MGCGICTMSVEHFEPLAGSHGAASKFNGFRQALRKSADFQKQCQIGCHEGLLCFCTLTRQDRFRNEGVVCRGAAFDFFNGIEPLCPKVGRCERAALDRTVFLQFCNFGRAVDSSLIETAAMYNVGTLNAEKTQSLCDCFEKIWRLNADQRIVWVSGIGERPQNVEDRAGF